MAFAARRRAYTVAGITIQRCRSYGCCSRSHAANIEVRPLFERVANDTNRRVREGILNPLDWQRDGPWAERLVEYMAVNDPSENLREHARRALAGKALEQAADAERRLLPERLRLKTERHPAPVGGARR